MATHKRKKTPVTAKRSAKRPSTRKGIKPLHDKCYPGETTAYRRSRDELLKAEAELRRNIESVAVLRRKLPAGGEVPQDYVFDGVLADGSIDGVRLSKLFAPGRDTLVIYNFMYGPKMESACPMCTSMLDALDGNAEHITQRVNLAVVARSPLPRILAFASKRGWRRLRLLSSAGNSYNRDYFGENAEGAQMPMLNVFVRDRGKIRHFWGSELLYMPWERGQEPRHVDALWPLWNVLDTTPDGRGTDWHPKLEY